MMLEQEGKRSLWRRLLDFLIGYLPFLPVQMFILYDAVSKLETGAGKVSVVVFYIYMLAIFSGYLSEFGCGLRYRWRKKSDSRNSTKDANDTAEKASLEVVRADCIDLVGGDEYDLFMKYGLGNQYGDASVSEKVNMSMDDLRLVEEKR